MTSPSRKLRKRWETSKMPKSMPTVPSDLSSCGITILEYSILKRTWRWKALEGSCSRVWTMAHSSIRTRGIAPYTIHFMRPAIWTGRTWMDFTKADRLWYVRIRSERYRLTLSCVVFTVRATRYCTSDWAPGRKGCVHQTAWLYFWQRQ